MARGRITSIAESTRKVSKLERETRAKMEDEIVKNDTQPIPSDVVKNNPVMRKMFNKLKKLNDYFTEADSISLNALTFNMYLKNRHEQRIVTMDDEDENYDRFLLRIEKFNKQINESMKQLCIPLNSRLSLANDMAKVMLEEKKLEQMMEKANQPKEVNPLLALLMDEDDD